MALGGFLGGLANLGQIYGGYEQEQEQQLLMQQRLQYLQSLQQQRQQQVDIGKFFGAGGFGPGMTPLQAPAPSPLPQPPQGPFSGGGMPPGGVPPTGAGGGGGAAPPGGGFLPQVPNFAAGLGDGAAPTPPPGLTSFGGGMASGLNLQQPQMSPLGGPMPQLGGGPQEMFRSGLAPPTGGLGFGAMPQAPDFGSIGSLASGYAGPSSGTLTPPSYAGTDTGAPRPDLAGQQRLLPQYDTLGSTRPLGPGEFVMNRNGSWSSEYSVTVEDPRQADRYMVVPSLWLVNGKPTILSEDQAATTAARSGLNFPTFDNEQAAEAFSTQRENRWQQVPVGRSDLQSPLWTPAGGTDTGAAPGGGVANQITGILQRRGWSPAAIQGALANGMAESSLQPWGETGAAGEQGIWQFNPSGELPGFRKAYGDSRSVADQTNYMADRVEQTIPGYTRSTSAPAATDAFMTGFEKPARPVPGSRDKYLAQVGAGSSVGATFADMNRRTSPQEHAAGNYGAQALRVQFPQMPRVVSSFDTANQLAQMINQRLPGASDEEKGGVFLKLFPMMNDAAKEQTADAWLRYNAEVGQRKEAFTEAHEEETAAETRRYHDIEAAKVPYQIFQNPDGTFVRIPTRPGGQPEIIPGLQPGATRPGTGGSAAVQESVKLYEKLEADKLKGDEAAVKQDQQAIDDWNRAQGKGVSGRQSALAAARAGLTREHPEWNEDQIQDALGEYRRLNSIETGFGGGILGRNVISLNTVADHAQRVRTYFEALNNGNIPRANQIANTIAVETGKPEVTNFETGASIMTGEVVRLLTTTGGTEADRQHYLGLINARMSQAQGRGSLDVFDDMIDARFTSLEQQYSSVGGPEQQAMRRKRFEQQLLTEEARALHDSVLQRKKAAPGAAPAAPGAVPTEDKPALEVTPEEYEKLPSGAGYRVPGNPTVFFKQ